MHLGKSLAKIVLRLANLNVCFPVCYHGYRSVLPSAQLGIMDSLLSLPQVAPADRACLLVYKAQILWMKRTESPRSAQIPVCIHVLSAVVIIPSVN